MHTYRRQPAFYNNILKRSPTDGSLFPDTKLSNAQLAAVVRRLHEDFIPAKLGQVDISARSVEACLIAACQGFRAFRIRRIQVLPSFASSHHTTVFWAQLERQIARSGGPYICGGLTTADLHAYSLVSEIRCGEHVEGVEPSILRPFVKLRELVQRIDEIDRIKEWNERCGYDSRTWRLL